MRRRFLSCLLVVGLCAGCMAGQPPPPTGATQTAPTAGPVASATQSAAPTPTPARDFAPATAPAGGASPAPTLAATEAVSAVVGLITPASAVSVTQLALADTGKIDQVAWSPSGALLAAAGEGGVTLFDAATLSVTQVLTIGQWATSVAFDPSGQTVAVGTVGAIVQVWDLSRAEPTSLLLGPGVQVDQVVYDPAGRGLLASLGVDNRAHLWNLGGQEYLRELGAGLRPAIGLAFSPGGEWLATAEGDRVLLWPIASAIASADPLARSLPAPAGRRGAVTALAFDPAGGQLAVANAAGSIELWDPANGQPRLTLARLNSPAQHLAYSPDGRVLASAHQDRTLRLWEAGSGQLLITLPGHTDVVTSLAFSPDGARLASSGWDGTVRVWGLR